MATKITAILVDDLDGSTDDVATHQFAFNGITYEIDLSAGNFDRMAAAFGPFLMAGRRLPKQPRAARRQRGGSAAPRPAASRARRSAPGGGRSTGRN
ncbi:MULTISPECIES: Lsr2 dimerization domain-containing protein [unclassified Micromonospora]|uniref:Lsr2 dimerization domain-containing protein n=1 Tax=unclassified Micromonospora TaxID=2617518 RepID=UPI002FF159A8